MRPTDDSYSQPEIGARNPLTKPKTLERLVKGGSGDIHAAAQNRLYDLGWEFRPRMVSRSMEA